MHTLFAFVMAAFVAIGVFEFSSEWPGAQRGLLLYEKTCPLNTTR